MIDHVRANWFWPLAAVLMLGAWLISRSLNPAELAGWELAVIFDVIVTLPLLFVLCYLQKLRRNKLIIQIMALQCLGIWLAAKIVPTESQQILPQLEWVRYAGLVVLVLIEVRVMIVLFRIVFKAETSEKQLEEIGMPPFLAKLALIEARFWRRLFSLFKK